MPRAQKAEMTMVQRRKLGLVQALNYCQHRCVYEADIGVSVALAELQDPRIICWLKFDNLKGSHRDVLDQRNQNARMQAATNKIVDLRQYWSWYDERFRGSLDERSASAMVSISSVQ
jgi:hypothetical protein